VIEAEARPNGRIARRKAAYYAAVAAGSDHRTRVSERSAALAEPVAAASGRGRP
jgi:hypothetical protein